MTYVYVILCAVAIGAVLILKRRLAHYVAWTLMVLGMVAGCGSATHTPPTGGGLGGGLPAIDGDCTTANNEAECRSDVDCVVPGECCVKEDGGACLATCQPCCLYFGSSGDGAQKLKCQTS